MSNLVVVIADEDEQYLMPLELKFIDELRDKAEIIIISSRDYLQSYFRSPRKIDILIINKSLYSSELDKHDIENLFFLSEEMTENSNEIYKYTSVGDIFNYVSENIKENLQYYDVGKENTKVILIYSPIGGCGKTTIAAGISTIISKQKKKVLFISTENFQSFSYLLKCDKYLAKSFERSLLNKDYDIGNKLKEVIQLYQFCYLPPMRQAPSLVGITLENYIHLISKAKELNIYDYIIIDSTSDLNNEKCKLMNIADKVVIVSSQDIMSVKKIDSLLDNIDSSDSNKFIFICNKYNKKIKNHLMDNTMNNCCIVKNYVSLSEEEPSLEKIAEYEGLEKFVYNLTLNWR